VVLKWTTLDKKGAEMDTFGQFWTKNLLKSTEIYQNQQEFAKIHWNSNGIC